MARPVVLGNWKMNGLRADGDALIKELVELVDDAPGEGLIGVCPPATLLGRVGDRLKDTAIALGGQDCASEAKGAFTGDISAPMLNDIGCSLVIVGHSERRHGHGEDDERVRAKAAAAIDAGLTAVLCIGETETDYTDRRTIEVLDGQLKGSLPERAGADNLILAYEPVWAIGTGRTPSIDEIRATHAHLHDKLAELVPGGKGVSIVYGGSVKAANAAEIMAVSHVDGALVGGASLNAEEFVAIWGAATAKAAD